MKRVKGVKKKFHKLAMKAVADYYGYGTNLNVLKAIEGERVELTGEEKSDVFAIRANLADKVYCESFI